MTTARPHLESHPPLEAEDLSTGTHHTEDNQRGNTILPPSGIPKAVTSLQEEMLNGDKMGQCEAKNKINKCWPRLSCDLGLGIISVLVYRYG